MTDRRAKAAKAWISADGRFLFGKHDGELVETVAREDIDYLRWIIETVDDIDPGDRQVILAQVEWAARR